MTAPGARIGWSPGAAPAYAHAVVGTIPPIPFLLLRSWLRPGARGVLLGACLAAGCGDDGGGGVDPEAPVDPAVFCGDFRTEICRRWAPRGPDDTGGRNDPRYDADDCTIEAVEEACMDERLTLEAVFRPVYGDRIECAATNAQAEACLMELEAIPVTRDETEIPACADLCVIPAA